MNLPTTVSSDHGPPTPIKPMGTYGHSASPEPPPPPISEKGYPRVYPLSRVLVTVGNYKHHSRYLVFSIIFPRLRPKIPPFPRKLERASGPLMHSSGGGGGGGTLTNSLNHSNIDLISSTLYIFGCLW